MIFCSEIKGTNSFEGEIKEFSPGNLIKFTFDNFGNYKEKETINFTTVYNHIYNMDLNQNEYLLKIKDAVINSEINGIDNTLFFAGDMKEVLTTEFIATHGKPQVVITDPPRAGMHEDVCKKLLFMRSEKIVYISCNPATQARDIAILDEAYEVAKIQPVDMFPHTEHVENIVLLTLKK